jgi:hypothetical protein
MEADAREVEALTREGEQYRSVGMLDRLLLVNEQLALRGAALVDVPKPDGVVRQKRTSTQAATRTKRTGGA